MSRASDIETLLRELIAQQGFEDAERTLRSIVEDAAGSVLTIIPNIGIHRIPDRYLRGAVFVGSEGNLDFSSRRGVESEYKKILLKLKDKLLSQPWSRIYLIPTGHVTLSMQIKLFVYQLTRINTIDLFYLNGRYFELRFDARDLEVREGSKSRRTRSTASSEIGADEPEARSHRRYARTP
jgi:hypothetical protein